MKKLLLASFMLVSTSVFAHNLPQNSKWSSDYAPGKGTYIVKVVSKDEIELTVDENICGFNDLGDVSFCTLMFFFPIKGVLNTLPIPAPRSTLVYSLENTDYRIVHDVTKNGYIRLLTVDENGGVKDSVRLFKK
ncbi:hypothetical protein ACWNT8_09160 [Pigmentibacter ruber]